MHPSGARHLVDPTKLLVSAERVFGEMLDLIFGRLLPTEASRIVAIDHLQDIAIGPARLLTALHTPGHAKHHVAFHDSESGLAFVGDAVGVRLPEVGVVRPATPPPDFDVEETVASIRLLRDRSPSGIAFAHYGLVDDSDAVLQEGEEMLHRWTDVAVRAERCGLDIDRALGEHFDHELLVMDARAQEIINALNGTHSNAAGFRRWLSSPCG